MLTVKQERKLVRKLAKSITDPLQRFGFLYTSEILFKLREAEEGSGKQ